MTRVSIALLTALCLGACAGSPRVPQRDVPPPGLGAAERRAEQAARTPTDEAETRRFLDEQLERRGTHTVDPAQRHREQAFRTTTDEAETQRFLDEELERRAAVEPPPPPLRIVERVYVPAPDYRRERRHRYALSRFPWHTAWGAGLGAIIGHQSGHRDRGAAIGAGVGLLFDLHRWYP